MLESPACPICDSHAWEVVGKRVFQRGERAPSPYVALRLRVLFELWTQGEEQVELRFTLCRSCGFVTYLPRASADEVDRKYRFLAGQEGGQLERGEVLELDRKRSEELMSTLAGLLPEPRALVDFGVGTGPAPRRVLDFGGGNGALCSAFAERGWDCSVVDYVTTTVPGVKRLCSTLEELPEGCSFDLVVCSHVIEHLADPLATVRKLASLVREGGLLFVAVPLELRGGPPKMAEPVTHVNFFCRSSLGALLSRAGLHVVLLAAEPRTSSHGASRPDVLCVGRKDPSRSVDVALPGCDEARALLRPRGIEGVFSWFKRLTA